MKNAILDDVEFRLIAEATASDLDRAARDLQPVDESRYYEEVRVLRASSLVIQAAKSDELVGAALYRARAVLRDLWHGAATERRIARRYSENLRDALRLFEFLLVA